VAPLKPRVSRPGFAPGYGITAEPEGLLPWAWADERLAAARTYWVGSTRPDGGPHAAPVWGLWLGGAVCFSTSRGSRKGLNLARDPRCVVHLESGDEVVIIEGRVEEISLDEQIADAYATKYDFRPELPAGEGEAWFRLRPVIAFAWTEREFPRTATRFAFDGETPLEPPHPAPS
jgi:hypothetical protein